MRTNLILASIAALLAVPTTLSYVADADIYTGLDQFDHMFEGLTADKVDVILLRRPKQQPSQPVPSLGGLAQGTAETQFDELYFGKQNGRWVIARGDLAGAPVAAELIDQRIFQHMTRVPIDSKAVIIEDADPEILASSLLTADTAFVISCQVQQPVTTPGAQPTYKVLAELLVGKDNRAGRLSRGVVPGFHVRKSDSNDVILYEVPFWERPMDPNSWVEKDVHNLNQGVITRFSLNNSKVETPVVFERKPGSDATWIATEKPEGMGAVRQMEVTNMISRYKRIQATSLIGPASAANLGAQGLLPPVMEIAATLDDGSVHTILIGHQLGGGKKEHYVLSSGLSFVRTIPIWVVENFQLDPRDLFDPAGIKPPEPPEVPKVPKKGKAP